MAYTFKDWVRAYQEAHLEEVILIELSGEQAEDNLYRALSERAIVPRKLAPGIFVVEARLASFYDLRSRLEKGGIVVRGEPATRRYQS